MKLTRSENRGFNVATRLLSVKIYKGIYSTCKVFSHLAIKFNYTLLDYTHYKYDGNMVRVVFLDHSPKRNWILAGES